MYEDLEWKYIVSSNGFRVPILIINYLCSVHCLLSIHPAYVKVKGREIIYKPKDEQWSFSPTFILL